MKTKPILFSTEMVQAILEGRKTQTRRVVKNIDNNYDYLPKYDCFGFTFLNKSELSKPEEEQIATQIKSPYGNIGDILWVRESFYTAENYDHFSPSQIIDIEAPIYFKADLENFEISRPLHRGKMRPSIHMPKEAARIFLKITNVRVERLHDITGINARKEGVQHLIPKWKDYLNENDYLHTSYASFKSLWKSINGEESWNSNPWVWVIEFERVEKPLNF